MNIRLAEYLVHRILYHIIPRAQKEHADQPDINTMTISDHGSYIG